MIAELLKRAYFEIHDRIYNYKVVKENPSDWVEKNVYLTGDLSRYQGYLKYELTPYSRELIDNLSSSSPVEMMAVMKCAQSGISKSVIYSGICYIISETPAPILFTAADVELAKLSVRTSLDPMLELSGVSKLIRPNVIKKKNQRSGDTDFSKEFSGGSLIALGVNNPNKWRQYSVKYIFADDWEAAPRSDKKEGSVRSLMENRATSFGTTKKLFYISTPAIKQTSNIEEVYNLGDKRKWHWECPHCKTYIPMEWQIKKEDGGYSGIKWELDERGELIKESVHYECQNCNGKIFEKEKPILNNSGMWIPTVTPKRENFRSYQLNALVIPPGFTSWVDLVYQWLDAYPPNDVVDEDKLKAFVNTRLGQTWEEKGTTPRVTELMQNTRSYEVGVVPDQTIDKDGNGKVIMISLACDLGGVMEQYNEDVRLDWEIIAHTSTGVTYSINHGSIGTFKRSRKKSRSERENDTERVKWTYSHGMPNSVWGKLKEVIEDNLIGQSGDAYNIDVAVIDTGHFTRLAYEFIDSENNPFIVGIKGYAEDEYRRLTKDTPIIMRSRERQKLYILQVNQLKDILASNMKLRVGMDGYQPSGFMNFPQPENGKYTMRNYFEHYEGEHRTEVKKGDTVIGYQWKKKNSSVENHFFDIAGYNIAAREIYIEVLRRNSKKYSKLTYEDYVILMS